MPFHVVSIEQDLDLRDPRIRRSPHAMVQEYLNNSDSLWGVVTNGRKFRVLRSSARVARPAYVEFDVEGMMESNQYAEFSVLFRLLHRTRLPSDDTPPQECLLERYYQQGVEDHSRVREKLRTAVEQALLTFGNGFLKHPNSGPLRERFHSGALTAEDYYRQLLRLVYRLLFLMVAEERHLLQSPDSGDHALHRINDHHYAVSRLRERAERWFANDDNHDIWAGLKKTFEIFRDDDSAQKLGLSALDGELFGGPACRDLEAASCENRGLLNAMLGLSTFMDERNIRRRVNYAGIDVEEFGSVYESLLDFHPQVQLQPQPSFWFVSGTERKETGSYYTPPDLVNELVESALVPVIQDRLANAKTTQEKIDALLNLKICDPAAGSGHFLLAAARRVAGEVAKLRTGDTEPTPGEYRRALRDVIRRCIYAVDKNALAVDLCKVALWIEGHQPGFPLSFLDHRIRCGDSLVGVADLEAIEEGIPDGAYKVITGDDRAAAAEFRKRNRNDKKGAEQLPLGEQHAVEQMLKESTEELLSFTVLEENTAGEVRAKNDLYYGMRGQETDWYALKVACDFWTSAFFMPKKQSTSLGEDSVATTGVIRRWLRDKSVHGQLTCQAVAISEGSRFFHWPLEFPDVFANGGGFDVVLGNPPWEAIRPEEQSFFRVHDPDIASLAGATRKRAIDLLPGANPSLARAWDDYKHGVAASSAFARESARFPLGSHGVVNTYAVFTELARRLLAPNGRSGMIVPTGLATDHNTRALFQNLVHSKSLVSLYDFENREAIFTGVHRSYKFCLLTATGSASKVEHPKFAFFLHQPAQIHEDGRTFNLTAEDFRLFNPNTQTCPIFRTEQDMAIARKMYHKAGVLIDESGPTEVNPWGVSFMRMFDMTGDSGLFRTGEQLEADGWTLEGNEFLRGEERYVPLYEAKLFHQYDHRFATFEGVSQRQLGGGNARNMTVEEKADPNAVILPRYWVREDHVSAHLDRGDNSDEVSASLDKYDVNAQLTSPAQPSPAQPSPAQPSPAQPSPAQPSPAQPSPAQPSPAQPSPAQPSTSWPLWLAACYQEDHQGDRWADRDNDDAATERDRRLGGHHFRWILVFRDIARPTDIRTAILTILAGGAVSNKAPLMLIDPIEWIQAFRNVARATDERTLLTATVPESGMGNSAPIIDFERARAIASALVLANMNSIPLDWAARMSVGGVNLNFFIVKQLPVLPPEAYLEDASSGDKYVELVVPRVLELAYTAYDLHGFAEDLGYDGPPFAWDEERRHRLRCELDAVYAHMYQLDRSDLEWILDAPAPSSSFPTLKRNEIAEFGEYRTQRYVLHAYDQIARGEPLDLDTTAE